MAQTVLITGASGFIAAHVIELSSKRDTIFAELIAIVPDIAAPNAFDEAVKGVDGASRLTNVIHTASPVIFNATDFDTELLQPAISGTTGILEAVQKYNSAVSRIIITSSSPRSWTPHRANAPDMSYAEANWNPLTIEQANSSPKKKPNFTVATLCPPMVYGPVAHAVSGVNALNTSAGDIYRLIKRLGEGCSRYFFLGIRRFAEAHVLAFEKPQAAGQRYLIANSAYSYQLICDIIRDKFPELQNKTPKGDTGAALPPVYKVDTTKAVTELGIKFRPLQDTIVDMVNSLLALQK
ncbi:dihydroflavonol-4-reductase [Trichoderma gamsii]|uniref:Dihydroflavonol-4-reductase n=1 Tax=Trichoderma gamsii TaxID=398673 RepID=A0A2P4ZL63_9HYPO|nr:dihydroflavonol-4-reductase [Trichoderma gamsii]PON25043.1 dihydroflavonol-4-reductase [Trichoderma gamsii]